MNKNLLITGATGYLGFKLLKELLDHHQIFVIKRATSDISKIAVLSDRIKFYNSDEESIENVFKAHKIDLVIHLATLYGRKGEGISQIKEVNLDFPLIVLKYAFEYNVPHFINTGTSLPPLTNLYSLFKHQFSQCLEFHSSKITVIDIALEHFYGPDDDDSKFITSIVGRMKSNVSEIELTAGTQLRDFIFIEDVLSAYLFIISSLYRFNGYNVLPLGSGETVTIREIVENIKAITLSHSNLLFGKIPMRTNELMCSNADISILNNLGWRPKFTLNQGLKITAESFNQKK